MAPRRTGRHERDMRNRILAVAAFIAALAAAPAFAHGGGGVVFVPIYIPGGAAPMHMGAQTGDYSRIHTVAVVSALGTNLTLTNDAFMGPVSRSVNVDDWKVDDELTGLVRGYLGSRFTVKDIAYDHAALAAIPNGRMDTSTSAVTDYLRKLPADGVDAFIVVRPDLNYKSPGVIGLALENGSSMTGSRPVVWANYEMDIVDARTLTVLGHAYSRVRLREGEPDSYSGLIADKFLVLKDDEALDAKKRDLLHAYVSRLLNASAIETLRALQIGVALPEAGARTLVAIPADKDPWAKYSTVAVYSAVGGTLDCEHLGGTIFSTSSAKLPEPGWNMDALVERETKAALSKRFKIVDAAADRSALAGATLQDASGKVAPAFPGLTAGGADLYVVVVKTKVPVFTRFDGEGFGVWNHTPLGPEDTKVFAHYAVAVLDGHTLKLLGARTAVTSPDHTDAHPVAVVANSLWPGDPPAVTPEQAAKIHDALNGLVVDTIPETLLRLALTGQMSSGQPPPAPSAMGAAEK